MLQSFSTNHPPTLQEQCAEGAYETRINDIKQTETVLLIGLELAIDPPPRGNFVHYDFLKLHYIRHKIKDVSPLRVAAFKCNITLYMLPPPQIALSVPDNVSTLTCLYIFAC